MGLTFRGKLIAIVAVAATAFLVLISTGAMLSNQVEGALLDVQQRYLPRMEIGPRLESRFEKLQRGLQDAVAAHDADALAATHDLETALLEEIAGARGVISAGEATVLRSAVEDYYATAFDVSRRLLAGETGEPLVDTMALMQGKHTRTLDLMKTTTAFDRGQLARAFAGAARAQKTSNQARLAIGLCCLVVVIFLSIGMTRGVLAAVRKLEVGFKRFGEGKFVPAIDLPTRDELGYLAAQANQMAASLDRLSQERDRLDWIQRGMNGLAEEVRGELRPEEVAARGVAFLAGYLEAPLGAVYVMGADGALRLLGQYAGGASDSLPTSFRLGEGLVGQAAAQRDILVVSDPPRDYWRARSALGDAAVRALVLVPLVRADRVIGVLELGSFMPWSDRPRELLLAVREMFAVALEVARSALATRDLLAETQRQAARLADQEEALRVSNEELHAQQEELRQTNLNLSHQADELEAQRRVLEEQNVDLEETRRRLEQKAVELTTVSTYKSQFLANMSHELRTPLNSMLLISNLLAENGEKNLTAKQIELARTIHSAGKDLLALINQVLDLAKVESGKQEVHVEEVQLGELAARLERVFGPLARDKALGFTVEVSADAPPRITTDRQRLEQILNNLLGNAIKFTARGQVALRIGRPPSGTRLGREGLRHDEAVAFSVSDTGVGIAQADQERIFAPFEQVDTAIDRRYGGTGLGLSIAREMTSLLGGELRLESALGQGSTFTCILPQQLSESVSPPRAGDGPKPAAPAVAPSASPAPPAGHPPAADPFLLLIEDDAVFASAFGEIIEAQGLRYRRASDGRTGMALAKSLKPTGVILDVKLPDIDGWTVLRQLRDDPETAAIPVHFVSALEGSQHGMALGAAGYLTKPATRRQLIQVVESLAPHTAQRRPRVLVVEDDAITGDSLLQQLVGENLDVRRVVNAEEALRAVRAERFGCVVLDLSLPDMDGLELLRLLREACGSEMPSVVVYTARALSRSEVKALESYTEAIVLKDGSSSQRLLDEIRLFVRRLKDGLGARRSGALVPGSATAAATAATVRLEHRKILVADDDMRTVYALSATLRAKGAEVLVADTGQAALDILAARPDVELVLMDIMMPEMDGYEAMRRIRKLERFRDLPIVALTAKAMKGDEEKCREAGATDYLPKPVDIDRLMTMLQARLAGGGPPAPS
ncbi:MAG TPA: response regulator [Polyangia bacterium]